MQTQIPLSFCKVLHFKIYELTSRQTLRRQAQLVQNHIYLTIPMFCGFPLSKNVGRLSLAVYQRASDHNSHSKWPLRLSFYGNGCQQRQYRYNLCIIYELGFVNPLDKLAKQSQRDSLRFFRLTRFIHHNFLGFPVTARYVKPTYYTSV